MPSMEEAAELIEQDTGNPDDTVAVSSYHARRTYHELSCDNYPTVGKITRREAHQRYWVPCSKCVLSDS